MSSRASNMPWRREFQAEIIVMKTEACSTPTRKKGFSGILYGYVDCNGNH